MAQAAGPTNAVAAQQLGHYARLQQIEKVMRRHKAGYECKSCGLPDSVFSITTLQNVVDAISSAGFAMQELAKEQAHIDKHTLHKAVEYFLDQIEVSNSGAPPAH
jgi:hypothetical protein